MKIHTEKYENYLPAMGNHGCETFPFFHFFHRSLTIVRSFMFKGSNFN
jgi:hypothetical protein